MFLKDIANPSFKFGEGACPLNPNWDLIPQDRSLIAEGFDFHSAFGDSISNPAFWECSILVG